VHTLGGDVASEEVVHARGSLELPMSDTEIENKVKDLAAWGAKHCDVNRVIEAIWNLDEAADVSTLMELVRLS
jgi:hypothetical protein